MSGHRHRSSIKGAASFRRLLRALPDGSVAECNGLLGRAGPVLASNMRSRVGKRTGKTANAIAYRLLPKTMSLKVGLLTKALGRQFFGAHILDVGRPSKAVRVPHRRGDRPFTMIEGQITAHHIVRAGYDDFRRQYLPEYRGLMDRVLHKAAGGVGDD